MGVHGVKNMDVTLADESGLMPRDGVRDHILHSSILDSRAYPWKNHRILELS